MDGRKWPGLPVRDPAMELPFDQGVQAAHEITLLRASCCETGWP